MAMNRVAESYSTQNKRNEKLRWRARRDETYKNNGLDFSLKEHAYYRQGVTGYLKLDGKLPTRNLRSLNISKFKY